MEGTRLRILQLLQRNINDTVEGLAKAIGLAPATIRRHLDILQRDRLVGFEEVRKKTGRPEYSFSLTDAGQEALPKAYDMLLSVLVQELAALASDDTQGRSGEEILELAFKQVSSNVWNEYEGQVKGRDLVHRLATLVSVLNERDFSPEPAMVNGALRIKLHNCPFRLAALQNKSVCAFDANLIAAMLGVDLTRLACINDGDSGCMYTVRVNPDEATSLSAALEA